MNEAEANSNWHTFQMSSPSMAPVNVDLAVVVVTYNSAHVIGSLLDSMPAALDGLAADVVVVDNGSTDETLEILETRTDCRVIRSTNVGYSAGINRGVGEAERAQAILVLNPDVVLWPSSIRPLLDALDLPGAGIAAPQVRSADGSLYHSLRREPTLRRAMGMNWTRLSMFSEHVTDADSYGTLHAVDWAVGAVLLVSRACHDALGGWDESYFLYSEETQLSLDARRLGFQTVYVPDSVAMHLRGQSGSSNATHSMMVINRVRLYRRRHGAPASWCYYLLTIISELSWLARGQRRSWFAVVTLLRPSRRPVELNCSARILPV
jgi:N-acetylglucosaminyl-diphospho-decaprenol L-rhamnosyltransferase